MGSWNKTCGLSNLHIHWGTPVYVFVLEKNSDNNDDCYATSLYKPLLLPFDSEYNDYGGGENSGGIGLEPIMTALRDRLIEQSVGENEYHDIAVTREGFGEEQFFNAVRENRLFISDQYSKKPIPIKFTMFRKDIMDDILENHTFEEYVGGGAGNCGYYNNYIRVGYRDYVNDIRPMLDHIVSEINEYRNCDISKKTEQALFRSMMLFNLDKNRVAKQLDANYYRYSKLINVRNIGHKLLEDSSESNIQRLTALLTEYFKGVYVDMFMHSARKTWIPGGHEGSQDTSGDALRFLYASTIRVLNREDKDEYEE